VYITNEADKVCEEDVELQDLVDIILFFLNCVILSLDRSMKLHWDVIRTSRLYALNTLLLL
jgi:hypothetical protein